MEIAKSDLLQKTDYESTLSVALQDLEALGGTMGGNAGLSGADDISPNARVKATSTRISARTLLTAAARL